MFADLTYSMVKAFFARNRQGRISESIPFDGIKNPSLRLSRRNGGISRAPFSRGRDALAQSFLLQARCQDNWN